MADGNPRLRAMSPGQARNLCRIELRADQDAQERYKAWVDSYTDGMKTFDSSYRGMERGGTGVRANRRDV